MLDKDPTPATRFERTPILDLRFPPLPKTVAEVSALLNAPAAEPDTPRLADIVNADPIVAASVLRRINSAYYGLRRRISDIRKAVFLLGYLEVCNIVLTAGVMKLREVISSDEQAYIFDQIIRRSIGTAYYGQKISAYLDLPNKSMAFTVGLLHTTGRLVLLYNKPEDYEALWWTRETATAPEPDAERAIFGTDHTELSALAAERWQLPESITEAIHHYLTPEAIQDSRRRLLGLTLSVSLSATEQLCLKQRHASFQAGATVHALLKANAPGAITAEDLTEYIEQEQQQVRSYIEAMVQL